MSRRSYFFVLALSLCVIAVFVFYPTDKKRIRKVINSSGEAVIHEDIDGFMRYISYNYNDDYGGSYLFLRKRLEIVFKTLDDIDVEKDIMKISVRETQAQAELRVRVIASKGDNRGYIIGDAGKTQTIKVYFEKSPYKWKIIKVDGVFDYDS